MVKWNSAKIKDIARHRKESVTISDTECKLTAEIKKGVAGNEEIEAGELENMITTRHKRGYMLNCAKENVLTLTKDLFLIAISFVLGLHDFWVDFLLDVPELFLLS